MKMGEIIKLLSTSESYAEVRQFIPDSVIEYIRDFMPSQYNLFANREDTYIDIINALKSSNEL